MLRCLNRLLGQARPSRRSALPGLLAICALLGLVMAPFGSVVQADGPQQGQGEPALAASATMPLFFAFTTQGTQVHLRISMRNAGEAAWDPAQGIKLSRLGGDDAVLASESYPLERAVQPGQTANWDIVVTPQGAGVLSLRYTVAGRDGPFGSPARATVVVLPSLSGLGRSASGLDMESTFDTLTEWTRENFGDPLGRFATSVRSWFDNLINRSALQRLE